MPRERKHTGKEREIKTEPDRFGRKIIPSNREIAPGHSQIMLPVMSILWQMRPYCAACPNSPAPRPRSGWRNGTHTVTTGFLPHRSCWCWSRLKQMFPVKLWISPRRTHQHLQSLQATQKTRGHHATGLLPHLTAPFVRSVILSNWTCSGILCSSHKWHTAHSFPKRRNH